MNHPEIMAHDWFPRPLPPNVAVGARSWIYSSFAFLHYRSERPCGVRVGSDSGLYNGTFFDLGPRGAVEIGNYCTIVGAIISCDSLVVINDYAFVAHEVVIADHFAATPLSSSEKKDAAQGGSDPSIVIGANAWIGARAILLAGCKVGENAIVGAAAVIDFTIPPGAIVAGNPARVVGHIENQHPQVL
jgi:acetyltransferase-like isoleucine patch superfamily enzyme